MPHLQERASVKSRFSPSLCTETLVLWLESTSSFYQELCPSSLHKLLSCLSVRYSPHQAPRKQAGSAPRSFLCQEPSKHMLFGGRNPGRRPGGGRWKSPGLGVELLGFPFSFPPATTCVTLERPFRITWPYFPYSLKEGEELIQGGRP